VFSSIITAAAPELIQALEYFGLRRNNTLWPFPAYHCNNCFFSSAMEFGYIWFYYSWSFRSYKNTISEGHQFSSAAILWTVEFCVPTNFSPGMSNLNNYDQMFTSSSS